MTRTPTDFYAQYNNKAINKGIGWNDSKYGFQCVAGFKTFCEWAGIPVRSTPNNIASGYWTCTNANGQINNSILAWQKTYFEKITDPDDFKNGDWVILNKGSKSHPSSHIAMYIFGFEFGENQGGNGGFCMKKTDFSDALGALRWKGFIGSMGLDYGYSKHSFSTGHGTVNVDVVYGDHSQGYDLHMITADGWNKLQSIMDFDSDKLDILGGVNGNYFQMSNGCHLGVEGDGTVLGYSQEPKQSQWMALYQRNGILGRTTANDYWYRQDEIDFVCSPYCTRIFACVESISIRHSILPNCDAHDSTSLG